MAPTIESALPSAIQRVTKAVINGTGICATVRNMLLIRAACVWSGVSSNETRSPGAMILDRLTAR